MEALDMAFVSQTLPFHRPSISGGRLCRPSVIVRRAAVTRVARMQQDGSDDLLIVGAGVLGRLVGVSWLAAHPGSKVVAATRTDARHAELAALGMHPVVAAHDGPQFPRVLFCAPPSGSEDYAGDVAAAAKRAAPGGRFVFTSACSVYASADGTIAEDAPLNIDSPRAQRLLQAEGCALDPPGGCVLRLSGLYTFDRGPHRVYLRKDFAGKVSKDGLLCMIHYEDAATAAFLCLQARDSAVARKTFNVAGQPVRREAICEAVLQHPQYADLSMPTFDESAPVEQKAYDSTAFKNAVEWESKYPSMVDFFLNEAKVARQAVA